MLLPRRGGARRSKEEQGVEDNATSKNDESVVSTTNDEDAEVEGEHQEATQPRTISCTSHFRFPIREVMQPDGSTLFHHMQSIEMDAFDMDPDWNPDWNPDWEPLTSDDSSSDQDEEEEEDEHE